VTLRSRAETFGSVRDVPGSVAGTLWSRSEMLQSVAGTRWSSLRGVCRFQATVASFVKMRGSGAIQSGTLGLDSKLPLSLAYRTKGDSPLMRLIRSRWHYRK